MINLPSSEATVGRIKRQRHPATALTKEVKNVAKAPKRAFVCNDTGADYPRWQGQCSACRTGTPLPRCAAAASPTVARNERLSGYARRQCGRIKVQKHNLTSVLRTARFSTGFKEFDDRVLGGGVRYPRQRHFDWQ